MDALRRASRSVYPSPEPCITRVRREPGKIERTADDRTQCASRVCTRCGVPGFTQVTHPPCAVPQHVFVSRVLPSSCELAVVLKIISGIPTAVSSDARAWGYRERNIPIGFVCGPALLAPDDPVHCTNCRNRRFVRPLYSELVVRYIKR